MEAATVVPLNRIYNDLIYLRDMDCVAQEDHVPLQAFVCELLNDGLKFLLPWERRKELIKAQTHLKEFLTSGKNHAREILGTAHLPLPVACALATLALGYDHRDINPYKNDNALNAYVLLTAPTTLAMKLGDYDDDLPACDLTLDEIDKEAVLICLMDTNLALRFMLTDIRSNPSAYADAEPDSHLFYCLDQLQRPVTHCIWPDCRLSRNNDELVNIIQRATTRQIMARRAEYPDERSQPAVVHS